MEHSAILLTCIKRSGIILAQNIMREIIFQPKLTRNYDFLREILAEALASLHFAMRFFSHLANFDEIFVRKMSKSLNISLENNPWQ